MAKNVKVTPDQFGAAVMKALGEYGDRTIEITDKTAKTTARQTVSELKATSPVGRTGSYARGWSRRAQKETGFGTAQIVFNRTDWQLAHLLEKPHATGGGGHYPNKKDHTGKIAQIEEKYTQQFIEEVISKL